MEDIWRPVVVSAAFAYDFTELGPPAQVQLVDHEIAPLVTESTVVHCEPEVALDLPQRSW